MLLLFLTTLSTLATDLRLVVTGPEKAYWMPVNVSSRRLGILLKPCFSSCGRSRPTSMSSGRRLKSASSKHWLLPPNSGAPVVDITDRCRKNIDAMMVGRMLYASPSRSHGHSARNGAKSLHPHPYIPRFCRQVLTSVFPFFLPKRAYNTNPCRCGTACLDWELMASLGSRARTEDEHRALYEAAGLKITGIWRHRHGVDALIELEMA